MRRKTWVVWLLVALLVAGSLGLWRYRSGHGSAAAADGDLVTVQRVDFPLLVSAAGILEAARSVSIGPPRIPGEFRFKLARMVEEGKQVSEGDFLVEFDGSDIGRRLREETANFQRVQEEYQKKRSDFDILVRDLKLQLEQAKADLEKLENKLTQQTEVESAIVIAKTRIERDTAKKKVELLEQKLNYVSESGRLDLQISRANESHYRARMDALQDAMDSLTVTSPANGVVIYTRDWNGQPREVGSLIFLRDSVLELPDLTTIRAKVNVDEVDVGKIQIGQPVKIQLDAIQGKTFDGKIAAISNILKQASFDRPQRVAETLVEFQGSGFNQLRPGMSTRAQIQVGRYPDAIVIPLSSIQEREGRSFVQVWNSQGGRYDWREVQLQSNDGLMAVLSAGLQPSERIRSKPKA
jgi:hypothetical protein